MMKKVVEANGSRRAIVSCDGKIDWNYDQYYQEVQKAAKGFISLGKDFYRGLSLAEPRSCNSVVCFCRVLSCLTKASRGDKTLK